MSIIRSYALLFLKGIAMGAADVIPGVSGGTIAFISGIYEELIYSLNKLNFSSLGILFKKGFKSFWKEINGNFLLTLILGIALSFLSLAKLITFLLLNYPILVWSFFFGLIIASVWLIGKELMPLRFNKILAIITGAILAYYITTITPSSGTEDLWYLFLCGMIAICAMILPGISGSFILLLLGAYATVIGAIGNLTTDFSNQIGLVLVVIAGCITGLLLFSKGLNWLFKNYRQITIASMTGFLIGSLNKIWPWKQNLELLHTHSDGREEWIQSNISPFAYEGNPHIWGAISLCLVGFLTIFLLEELGDSSRKEGSASVEN